jgi:hypothetical protein
MSCLIGNWADPAALVVGVLGLIRAVRSRPAAIVASVAGALAFAFIVYGTMTA